MDQPLSEQVRKLIQDSGMTGYALHKKSGLSQSRIAAFLHGGDLMSGNLDRILAALPPELKTTLKP